MTLPPGRRQGIPARQTLLNESPVRKTSADYLDTVHLENPVHQEYGERRREVPTTDGNSRRIEHDGEKDQQVERSEIRTLPPN